MEGTLDFIGSSGGFEHVEPPVSRAFENARKLLKPGGVFVFSVPFSHPGEGLVPTKEHFPDLNDYSIKKTSTGYQLTNTTRGGDVQYFNDLVFHGGPGSTLEMRVFSESSMLDELTKAGFDDITIYSGSDLHHGIYWPQKWSVPLSARVGRKTKSGS